MSNETVTPIVPTDESSTAPSVPFYKNRRLIKVAAITTAVVGVVAVVSAKVKSSKTEEPAGTYVDVETTSPEA